jgi:hypothetical protein
MGLPQGALLHGIQLCLIVVVLALAVVRMRELGGRAGLATGKLFAALKHGRAAWIDAIAAQGETSALAVLSRASISSDPLDLEVALREERTRLGAGLSTLRVLGAASTALGFAGALFDIAWIGQDHGILDLDPQRIARTGLESAALGMALGIGGSALALSSLMALRDRAKLLAKDIERFTRLVDRDE